MEVTGYEKPKEMLPLAMWAIQGDEPHVYCMEWDCKAADCYGCPCASRRVDGVLEYYRPPLHGGASQ